MEQRKKDIADARRLARARELEHYPKCREPVIDFATEPRVAAGASVAVNRANRALI